MSKNDLTKIKTKSNLLPEIIYDVQKSKKKKKTSL